MTNSTPHRKTHLGEIIAETLIRASGLSAIIFVVLIFAFLVREGVPAFFEVKPDELFDTRWYPNEGLFGLWPLILGSVLVTLGATMMAVPIGLLAAVFIAEIAPRWLREILKPLVEVLAGFRRWCWAFWACWRFRP